jgi:hypothetical protein
MLVNPSGYVPSETTKFILMSMDKADQAQILASYSRSVVQLREWWVPTECKAQTNCLKNAWNYFISRTIWNEKGGFDIYLYQKN